VCLAPRLPAPPDAPHRTAGLESSPITAADAYRHRLFHGPRFHCLKEISALNECGVRARVSPSRPADVMAMKRRGSWIIDPILLDAGPQLLILWAQEMRGTTTLPCRFGAVQIFDGFDAALRLGLPLECRLLVDARSDSLAIVADYQVFGPGGDIILCVEGLEGTGSTSLNRLADMANVGS